MEWCIPIQTFQTENVQLGQLLNSAKPMIPLGYKDPDFTFPSLSILLPALSVKSHDASSGRLVLNLTEATTALGKLVTLQDMLLTAVSLHQRHWFSESTPFRMGDLKKLFQPMIENQELHLYCPPPSQQIQGPAIFTKDGWITKPQPGLFKTGSVVRIAIKIQGVSFHIHSRTNQWTGKFRLQHKILAILHNGGDADGHNRQ